MIFHANDACSDDADDYKSDLSYLHICSVKAKLISVSDCSPLSHSHTFVREYDKRYQNWLELANSCTWVALHSHNAILINNNCYDHQVRLQWLDFLLVTTAYHACIGPTLLHFFQFYLLNRDGYDDDECNSNLPLLPHWVFLQYWLKRL